ncbi:MAG TPA: A/G-specific adenine glycosylase [Deltaproteobacteria bacterium]|nr:A/G-specific adenine glycosylase [Deltaproteobacteria bacterium]
MCAVANVNGDLARFVEFVRDRASTWYRPLPWRENINPYRVLVSEFMLQQTGVERVAGKYGAFLARFPDVGALAGARLADVLAVWQGLGYNRRAVHLWKTANAVVSGYGGRIPERKDELTGLPGIAHATAGAIIAFAYNRPAVFIETNIRRVFIHFFFEGRSQVKDLEILPLVEATLDGENPRKWYYALMDCGAMLGRLSPNPNRRSSVYAKQAPFEGSDRQVRGRVIRSLLGDGPLTEKALLLKLGVESSRLRRILAGLEGDGLIARKGQSYQLP